MAGETKESLEAKAMEHRDNVGGEVAAAMLKGAKEDFKNGAVLSGAEKMLEGFVVADMHAILHPVNTIVETAAMHTDGMRAAFTPTAKGKDGKSR